MDIWIAVLEAFEVEACLSIMVLAVGADHSGQVVCCDASWKPYGHANESWIWKTSTECCFSLIGEKIAI
jgi:hypothetical protein